MSAPQPHVSPDSGNALAAARQLIRLGRLREAAEACATTLERDPEQSEALFLLAGLRQRQGRAEEALVLCRKVVELQPGLPQARHRLGLLLELTGDPAGAAEAYREAAALAPEWPAPVHNLASLRQRAGDLPGAITGLREAIRRDPAFAPAHAQLGPLLLARGDADDWREGWKHFEWRFGAGGETPKGPGCDAPIWDGSPLDGEVVLIWLEQGYGDQIQFARFAEHLHRRGGRVWLQASRPLIHLFASLPGVERLLPAEEPLGEAVLNGVDFQIPLMSLPRVLGIGPDASELGASVPYLTVQHPDPRDLAAATRRALTALGDRSAPPASVPPFQVGIVWASRSTHPSAPRRDCPLENLLPLARLPGVELHALQFGDGADDLDRLPKSDLIGSAVVDHRGALGDFAVTAAFVREMDLILTVDTAMAHLAGALGKPTWVLLGEPADWRWMLDREDSPWYPTMRLFRQRRAGDWGELIGRVREALVRELEEPPEASDV